MKRYHIDGENYNDISPRYNRNWSAWKKIDREKGDFCRTNEIHANPIFPKLGTCVAQ